MDSKTIAKGIRRYKAEESSSTFLIIETFICSAMIGAYFKSWGYFGVSLLFFYVSIFFRPLYLIISIAFSLFWALTAFTLVMAFFEVMIAAIIVSIVVFLIAFGTHLGGYEGFSA